MRLAAVVRRVVLVAVLISTPVLLGGCGEETDDRPRQPDARAVLTHEQYQQAILEILRGDEVRMAGRLFFDVVGRAFDVVGRAQDSNECADQVRAFHDQLRAIIRQVEDLDPPADADDIQRRFLEAAQESVRLVGVAADDVGNGQLKCGPPLNNRIYGLPSTERAQEEIATLERRGYFVFGE